MILTPLDNGNTEVGLTPADVESAIRHFICTCHPELAREHVINPQADQVDRLPTISFLCEKGAPLLPESWMHGKDGALRPELYTQSPSELDAIQARAALMPDWVVIPPALAALKEGDKIYIHPKYSVAAKFNGEMTFIRLDGVSGAGPCLFCRTADRGGTFVSQQMLVNRNNPTQQANPS